MEENALLVTVDQLCNHFYMAKEFSAIHVSSARRQLITGKQIQQGPPKVFFANHKTSSEQKNWSSFISGPNTVRGKFSYL